MQTQKQTFMRPYSRRRDIAKPDDDGLLIPVNSGSGETGVPNSLFYAKEDTQRHKHTKDKRNDKAQKKVKKKNKHKQKKFDSTLGFPGEGPPRAREPRERKELEYALCFQPLPGLLARSDIVVESACNKARHYHKRPLEGGARRRAEAAPTRSRGYTECKTPNCAEESHYHVVGPRRPVGGVVPVDDGLLDDVLSGRVHVQDVTFGDTGIVKPVRLEEPVRRLRSRRAPVDLGLGLGLGRYQPLEPVDEAEEGEVDEKEDEPEHFGDEHKHDPVGGEQQVNPGEPVIPEAELKCEAPEVANATEVGPVVAVTPASDGGVGVSFRLEEAKGVEVDVLVHLTRTIRVTLYNTTPAHKEGFVKWWKRLYSCCLCGTADEIQDPEDNTPHGFFNETVTLNNTVKETKMPWSFRKYRKLLKSAFPTDAKDTRFFKEDLDPHYIKMTEATYSVFRGIYPTVFSGLIYLELANRLLDNADLRMRRVVTGDKKVNDSVISAVTVQLSLMKDLDKFKSRETLLNTQIFVINQLLLVSIRLNHALPASVQPGFQIAGHFRSPRKPAPSFAVKESNAMNHWFWGPLKPRISTMTRSTA